jgi:hypothetical protein
LKAAIKEFWHQQQRQFVAAGLIHRKTYGFG